MGNPRILTLDIETMPAIAEVWSIWQENIPIQRIREAGYVFGVGYKWHGEKAVYWVDDTEAEHDIADTVYALLCEADIVVTYNGDKFDLPKLKKVLLAAGYGPPSPFKSVDLYRTVKGLGLESSKLDYAVQYFGLGSKIHTEYSLWQGCMAGDPVAIAKMARYCKQDVKVTEKLHDFLLPWIKNYPNVGFWSDGGHRCPACNGANVQRRGKQVAIAMTYDRFQCQDCGKWSRSATGDRLDAPLRPL